MITVVVCTLEILVELLLVKVDARLLVFKVAEVVLNELTTGTPYAVFRYPIFPSHKYTPGLAIVMLKTLNGTVGFGDGVVNTVVLEFEYPTIDVVKVGTVV